MANQKKRIEEIYHLALEKKDKKERSAYLDSACGNDSKLRVAVEGLLQAHDKAGNFLEVPPFDPDVTLDTSPLAEGPGTTVGNYKLLEQIGEGGMGIVYLAEQQKPIRRKVALKIIKPGMDSKQVIARFEAEQQALALLDHPNIAYVIDAGTTEASRPYFVMEYVKGVPITEYCDLEKLTVEERLGLFLVVCEAVQHAHQKGIIHRDIKPTNILVAIQDGQIIPKIIDFGIAKAIYQPLTDRTLFTEQGQLIGTPEYMSPEQAEMTNQDIDTRSDIYSLGVLLYELLTGTLPFERKELEEAGFAEIQRIIREKEPPHPSARISSLGDKATKIAQSRRTQVATLTKCLRKELEWIPLKAIRKERSRRYKTAAEFADDIRNYLNDAPLIAGPESAIYRLKKFVRRNRASVTGIVAVAVALMLGLVVSSVMYYLTEQARENESIARAQANQAEKVAEGERKKALDTLERTQRLLYISDIRAAHEALKQKNSFLAEDFLDRCPEKFRHWEWYRLNSLLDRSIMTLRGHAKDVCSVAISPDGKRIVSGSVDNTVKVWDAATGTELTTFNLDTSSVSSMTFSPDGKQIATWNEQTIGIWDAARGTKLKTFVGRQEKTQSETTQSAGQVLNIGATAFSPDGKRIAFCDRLVIRILDLNTGEELNTITTRQETSGQVGQRQYISMLAFSPDGKQVVSIECRSSFDQNTFSREFHSPKVWDAESGEELMVLREHENEVMCVAFSPDGKRIVSGSYKNGAVKVWDAESGEQLMRLTGHKSRVLCVAFSPNGKRIVSGGGHNTAGTLKIWDVESGEELMILRGHESEVMCVTFSPDGRLIASGSGEERAIKLWDAATGAELMTLYGHTGSVWPVAFSPDSKRLVSGSADNTVRVWDVATGTELLKLREHGYVVSSVAFSPDGKCILSASRGGSVRVLDATTGKELKTIVQDQTERTKSSSPTSASFSPDGKRIVSGGYDHLIKMWDAMTGNELSTLPGHEGRVLCVAFSPDGKRIVSGGGDHLVKLWDVESGRELMTLHGHRHNVMYVAFSTDGRLIASGSCFDKAIKLWDASTGKELITFHGHHSEWLSCVSLSPDGKRIVSGGGETIQVWDTRTGTELRMLHHDRGVHSLAFCPDGKRIASGGKYGTIRIWDVTNGEEFMTLSGRQRQEKTEQKQTDEGNKDPATHLGLREIIDSLAFSPNGKRLVSACKDGTIKVWDMQNGAELMTLLKRSSCVSFSPDGNRILLVGFEITLLDADSGRIIGTIRMPREQLSRRRDTVRSRAKATAKICSVAFSPDGRCISSGSSDGWVKVWDIETGAEVANLSGYTLRANHFAFSPDGKQIASSSNRLITIRDGATGEVVVTLRGHNNSVGSMAFSPDGKQIVSCDGYGVVKVWDVETGAEAMTMWESSRRIMFSPFVSYSPDGTRIISCGQHMSVRVGDAVTGAELMTLMGHKGYTRYTIGNLNGKVIESGEGLISSVAFSPDGKRFITGSSDKTIKVWDFTMSPEVRILDVPHSRIWIHSVVFSHDGKRIAVCGNGVKVLDAYSGQELITIRIHAESKRDPAVATTAVKFSPDGKHIVSGHDDKTIRVWDAITGEELMTLGGHYDGISSVDYSPDGNKIVSGSRDKIVKVWDATTGEELMLFAGHKRAVKSVAFSADGKRIVSFAEEIKLWDVATGKVLKTFPGESCFSFSPDSKQIVSGDGYSIKVWDVETGIEVMTMRGHSGPVYAVAFSPDGQRILSGGWKTVKMWDVVTGNELITLGEHYAVRCVAFSPDGKQVISAGAETIKLWDTASPEERALDLQEPVNSR